jgi:hypothetical protein
MNFAAWAGAGAEEASGGTVHSPINAKLFFRRGTKENFRFWIADFRFVVSLRSILVSEIEKISAI